MNLGKSPFLISVRIFLVFSLSPMGGEGRVRGGWKPRKAPLTQTLSPRRGEGIFAGTNAQTEGRERAVPPAFRGLWGTGHWRGA